jgi:hypothetical protein
MPLLPPASILLTSLFYKISIIKILQLAAANKKTAPMLKQRRGNKTNLPYSSIRTGPVQALTPQGGEIALDYALLST